MNVIATIFWGLVVLIIIVIVHELGHFLAARAFGVRVTEFMIGMPGPNIGFERNGCRYGVTCIPLGGYNRICGMEGGVENPHLADALAHVYRQGKTDAQHVALALGIDEAEAEEALVILDGWGSINAPGRSNKSESYAAPATGEYELGQARIVDDPKALLDEERTHTYRGLSFPKRLVVLFAGPVFNLILAFALIFVVFCGIGMTGASTTLSEVEQGGPAAVAGVQAGDTVVSVNGQEIPDWTTLSEAISQLEVGQEVTIGISRSGEVGEVTVTVGANDEGGPRLGVIAGTEQVCLTPAEALAFSGSALVTTVQAYASLFNPATAVETVSQSSSVVGIAVMSERAASAGLVPLLYIIAVISMSLGIVNLLPLPPLDGGKIVVEIIQRVIRRDLPARIVNMISVAVIVLLVLLFVVLLRQDIVNFVLGG